MSRAVLALALVNVYLYGCSMSNDDIISETKKCEESGFGVRIYRPFESESISKIECDPESELRRSSEGI